MLGDQFVEIVNVSGAPLDLTGARLIVAGGRFDAAADLRLIGMYLEKNARKRPQVIQRARD